MSGLRASSLLRNRRGGRNYLPKMYADLASSAPDAAAAEMGGGAPRSGGRRGGGGGWGSLRGTSEADREALIKGSWSHRGDATNRSGGRGGGGRGGDRGRDGRHNSRDGGRNIGGGNDRNSGGRGRAGAGADSAAAAAAAAESALAAAAKARAAAMSREGLLSGDRDAPYYSNALQAAQADGSLLNVMSADARADEAEAAVPTMTLAKEFFATMAQRSGEEVGGGEGEDDLLGGAGGVSTPPQPMTQAEREEERRASNRSFFGQYCAMQGVLPFPNQQQQSQSANTNGLGGAEASSSPEGEAEVDEAAMEAVIKEFLDVSAHGCVDAIFTTPWSMPLARLVTRQQLEGFFSKAGGEANAQQGNAGHDSDNGNTNDYPPHSDALRNLPLQPLPWRDDAFALKVPRNNNALSPREHVLLEDYAEGLIPLPEGTPVEALRPFLGPAAEAGLPHMQQQRVGMLLSSGGDASLAAIGGGAAAQKSLLLGDGEEGVAAEGADNAHDAAARAALMRDGFVSDGSATAAFVAMLRGGGEAANSGASLTLDSILADAEATERGGNTANDDEVAASEQQQPSRKQNKLSAAAVLASYERRDADPMQFELSEGDAAAAMLLGLDGCEEEAVAVAGQTTTAAAAAVAANSAAASVAEHSAAATVRTEGADATAVEAENNDDLMFSMMADAAVSEATAPPVAPPSSSSPPKAAGASSFSSSPQPSARASEAESDAAFDPSLLFDDAASAGPLPSEPAMVAAGHTNACAVKEGGSGAGAGTGICDLATITEASEDDAVLEMMAMMGGGDEGAAAAGAQHIVATTTADMACAAASAALSATAAAPKAATEGAAATTVTLSMAALPPICATFVRSRLQALEEDDVDADGADANDDGASYDDDLVDDEMTALVAAGGAANNDLLDTADEEATSQLLPGVGALYIDIGDAASLHAAEGGGGRGGEGAVGVFPHADATDTLDEGEEVPYSFAQSLAARREAALRQCVEAMAEKGEAEGTLELTGDVITAAGTALAPASLLSLGLSNRGGSNALQAGGGRFGGNDSLALRTKQDQMLALIDRLEAAAAERVPEASLSTVQWLQKSTATGAVNPTSRLAAVVSALAVEHLWATSPPIAENNNSNSNGSASPPAEGAATAVTARGGSSPLLLVDVWPHPQWGMDSGHDGLYWEAAALHSYAAQTVESAAAATAAAEECAEDVDASTSLQIQRPPSPLFVALHDAMFIERVCPTTAELRPLSPAPATAVNDDDEGIDAEDAASKRRRQLVREREGDDGTISEEEWGSLFAHENANGKGDEEIYRHASTNNGHGHGSGSGRRGSSSIGGSASVRNNLVPFPHDRCLRAPSIAHMATSFKPRQPPKGLAGRAAVVLCVPPSTRDGQRLAIDDVLSSTMSTTAAATVGDSGDAIDDDGPVDVTRGPIASSTALNADLPCNDFIRVLTTSQERHCSKQKVLLARGLAMLAEGGRLIYATSSHDPHQNEAIVASVLNDYGGAYGLAAESLLESGIEGAGGGAASASSVKGADSGAAAAIARTPQFRCVPAFEYVSRMVDLEIPPPRPTTSCLANANAEADGNEEPPLPPTALQTGLHEWAAVEAPKGSTALPLSASDALPEALRRHVADCSVRVDPLSDRFEGMFVSIIERVVSSSSSASPPADTIASVARSDTSLTSSAANKSSSSSGSSNTMSAIATADNTCNSGGDIVVASAADCATYAERPTLVAVEAAAAEAVSAVLTADRSAASSAPQLKWVTAKNKTALLDKKNILSKFKGSEKGLFPPLSLIAYGSPVAVPASSSAAAVGALIVANDMFSSHLRRSSRGRSNGQGGLILSEAEGAMGRRLRRFVLPTNRLPFIPTSLSGTEELFTLMEARGVSKGCVARSRASDTHQKKGHHRCASSSLPLSSTSSSSSSSPLPFLTEYTASSVQLLSLLHLPADPLRGFVSGSTLRKLLMLGPIGDEAAAAAALSSATVAGSNSDGNVGGMYGESDTDSLRRSLSSEDAVRVRRGWAELLKTIALSLISASALSPPKPKPQSSSSSKRFSNDSSDSGYHGRGDQSVLQEVTEVPIPCTNIIFSTYLGMGFGADGGPPPHQQLKTAASATNAASAVVADVDVEGEEEEVFDVHPIVASEAAKVRVVCHAAGPATKGKLIAFVDALHILGLVGNGNSGAPSAAPSASSSTALASVAAALQVPFAISFGHNVPTVPDSARLMLSTTANHNSGGGGGGNGGVDALGRPISADDLSRSSSEAFKERGSEGRAARRAAAQVAAMAPLVAFHHRVEPSVGLFALRDALAYCHRALGARASLGGAALPLTPYQLLAPYGLAEEGAAGGERDGLAAAAFARSADEELFERGGDADDEEGYVSEGAEEERDEEGSGNGYAQHHHSAASSGRARAEDEEDAEDDGTAALRRTANTTAFAGDDGDDDEEGDYVIDDEVMAFHREFSRKQQAEVEEEEEEGAAEADEGDGDANSNDQEGVEGSLGAGHDEWPDAAYADDDEEEEEDEGGGRHRGSSGRGIETSRPPRHHHSLGISPHLASTYSHAAYARDDSGDPLALYLGSSAPGGTAEEEADSRYFGASSAGDVGAERQEARRMRAAERRSASSLAYVERRMRRAEHEMEETLGVSVRGGEGEGGGGDYGMGGGDGGDGSDWLSRASSRRSRRNSVASAAGGGGGESSGRNGAAYGDTRRSPRRFR